MLFYGDYKTAILQQRNLVPFKLDDVHLPVKRPLLQAALIEVVREFNLNRNANSVPLSTAMEQELPYNSGTLCSNIIAHSEEMEAIVSPSRGIMPEFDLKRVEDIVPLSTEEEHEFSSLSGQSCSNKITSPETEAVATSSNDIHSCKDSTHTEAEKLRALRTEWDIIYRNMPQPVDIMYVI